MASVFDPPALNPWEGATQAKDGLWSMAERPCEIELLPEDHPKNKAWRPGEWEPGVDNVEEDAEKSIVREWGGQHVFEGVDADAAGVPENIQRLMAVPHMPGQPQKEIFARMKALDPRPFIDRNFLDVHRDMDVHWPQYVRYVKWGEKFGIHTETEPAEFDGQQMELVPSAYPTPRDDAVTLCVGVTGMPDHQRSDPEGFEYDHLEYLYAKDQEDKIVQIIPFHSFGMHRNAFTTYTFVPPKGTKSITPFAMFKLRGVWQGMTIEWDPKVRNTEMTWFTRMPAELRAELATHSKLEGKNKAAVAAVRYPKMRKDEPVLWPENSWEGNALKARLWDA